MKKKGRKTEIPNFNPGTTVKGKTQQPKTGLSTKGKIDIKANNRKSQ